MEEENKLKSYTFNLTYWQTKELLNQLENLMCIINRDNEPTYELYEIIISQLQGVPVTIKRPERKTNSVVKDPEPLKKWFEFWK